FAREIKSGKNYIATGYESRAITGCLNFDKDDWKRLSQVSVDFIAAPETQPRDLGLTITVSGTPVDPLNPGCSVKSFQMTPKKLRCPEPSPSAGSHPSSHAWWNLMLDSRYFILDFHVPAVTGGEFTLSTLS